MALDGLVTKAIVDELQACIGARIHKIHQPTSHELVFGIRGNGVQGKLLISANPTYPRVHWTKAQYSNPLEAPMFCMLLRKYCEGGVIEAVQQVNRERIIHLDIRHRDEIGDTSFKRIVIEIMGRHSNIILIDPETETIHDGIHHVTPALSSYRIVMPGAKYTAPPEQHKVDPLKIKDEAQFKQLFASSNEDEMESETIVTGKSLVNRLSGLSPLLANEMIYRSLTGVYDRWLPEEEQPMLLGGQLETDNGDALWMSFQQLTEQIKTANIVPTIVTHAVTGKQSFSITALTHIPGEAVTFTTISECLEAFYGDKAERDTIKQRAGDLIRFVQNEKTKNESKIVKLNATLEEAKDADRFRIIGELLTAYMHQMKRGDTSIEVLNYYDEAQSMMTIELDPQLTPSENAQRYFKRYTKQKNSQSAVLEQLELTEQELTYFNTILQQLDYAQLSDIEEIRDELVAGNYLRERVRKGPRKKKTNKPSLLCYSSSEGIDIYVGKNNLQNEYLTNRLAGSNDTWLHTKDIPGSHVVIRSNQFGDSTLEEAAMLAAHFSQAKESSLVPVDYTLVRHVKKPNGSKPGFVIYDHQKTLFITPDESKLKQLPHSIK